MIKFGEWWMISIFIVLFPYLIKYYYIVCIIIVFWLGSDRPSRLVFFVPALLLPYLLLSSYHFRLFLCRISFLLFPCTSVWENSCTSVWENSCTSVWENSCTSVWENSFTSSPFNIEILIGTLFFRAMFSHVEDLLSKTKYYNNYW